MHQPSRSRSSPCPLRRLLAAMLAGLALVGCGSSSRGGSGSGSASAQSLIQQTFSGAHTVSSGVLHFALTLTPAGSSTLTSPVSLGLDGPFQSRGKGNLPASDFTISVAALGRTSSLGLISTGTHGYVTLQGAAYQLPPADFKRLESGFSSTAASGTSHSGLAGLGINPQRWLTGPTVVGSADVGGADTTHIRAGVNVGALLADLNGFLARTTAKTKLPSSISPATAQKITAAVKNATVDLWTGKADRTLLKLALNLTVPATSRALTLLRGLRTAHISLTVQYADLNQPQTISAPTNVRPYSQLSALLRGLTSALQSAGASGQSSSSSTPASDGSKYAQCLQQAGRDVRKMQKCASLLGAGG